MSLFYLDSAAYRTLIPSVCDQLVKHLHREPVRHPRHIVQYGLFVDLPVLKPAVDLCVPAVHRGLPQLPVRNDSRVTVLGEPFPEGRDKRRVMLHLSLQPVKRVFVIIITGEGLEQLLEHELRVPEKRRESRIVVDMPVVVAFDLVKEPDVFRAQADPVLRTAVHAGVRDQLVHQHRRVDRAHTAFLRQLLQFPLVPVVQKTQRSRVLDVPAHVGDLVGDLDDAALPGRRRVFAGLCKRIEVDDLVPRSQAVLVHLAAMGDNPVPNGVGQTQVPRRIVGIPQQFDLVRESQAVLFVPEGSVQMPPAYFIDDLLALMTEGRMSQIVPDGDRARKLRVESQVTGDGMTRGFDMGDMLHPCADMIVLDVKEHLRLMLEPSVGQTVQDPVVVPRKLCPDLPVAGMQIPVSRDQLFPAVVSFVSGFISIRILSLK